MPHASSHFRQNSTWFLRLKPKNRSPMLSRHKPWNHLEKHIHCASFTILTRVTVVLDRPITKSLRTCLDLVNHYIDFGQHHLCSIACTLACRHRQVLAVQGSSSGPRSSMSVLHRLKFIGTNFLNLLHCCQPSQHSTPAHHKDKRHVAYTLLMPWLVSTH